MKSLRTYINEKLIITDRHNKPIVPKNFEELIDAISENIKFEIGDLNNINVSKLSDGDFKHNKSVFNTLDYMIRSNNVTEIDISQWNITTLYHGIFSWSEEIESIILPETLKIINQFAINQCKKLQSVKMNDSLEIISENAIGSCPKLTSINIPDSVKIIEHSAIAYCNQLKKINIGSGVDEIGNSPIEFCDNLSEIIVNKNNKKYNSGQNCNAIIETKSKKLILGCKSTQIPNTVTTINTGAFVDCPGLQVITIPESVKHIKEGAFHECADLAGVIIQGTPDEIDYDAFSMCQNLHIIQVPNNDVKKMLIDSGFEEQIKIKK